MVNCNQPKVINVKKSLKFLIIFIFSALILIHTISCQVKNPNNFTLIGAGYSGMYGGFSDLYQEKEALQIVAKRWGIKMESVGCVLTNKISWDLMKNNYEAERNLKKKYGRDWLEKFKNEVHIQQKILLVQTNH